MLSKETLRKENLSSLISQRNGLKGLLSTINKDLETVMRTIDEVARQEGIVADTLEALFSDQKIEFDGPITIGSTKEVLGHSVDGQEVRAYYCPGCAGWVKGEPEKNHLLKGPAHQEKPMEVEIRCWLDDYPLGRLNRSIPAKERFPENE
jgi:hypothetical protein